MPMDINSYTDRYNSIEKPEPKNYECPIQVVTIEQRKCYNYEVRIFLLFNLLLLFITSVLKDRKSGPISFFSVRDHQMISLTIIQQKNLSTRQKRALIEKLMRLKLNELWQPFEFFICNNLKFWKRTT